MIEKSLALQIDNLEVGHLGRTILVCGRLSLHRGEVLALLGASGSGKTTMFATIAGTISPIAGCITQDGVEVGPDWPRQQVARTLQNHPLLHWLSVRQNILLAARLRGVRGVNPAALLQKVAASHLADRWPATLSGGERCRVSLAMGLVSQPSVLLLDEPFNGLDPIVKREAANAVKLFVREQRCGAVLTTHDIEDALECSQRVAVIQKGAPSRVGEVWEVPENAHDRVELADRILCALACP